MRNVLQHTLLMQPNVVRYSLERLNVSTIISVISVLMVMLYPYRIYLFIFRSFFYVFS